MGYGTEEAVQARNIGRKQDKEVGRYRLQLGEDQEPRQRMVRRFDSGYYARKGDIDFLNVE